MVSAFKGMMKKMIVKAVKLGPTCKKAANGNGYIIGSFMIIIMQ